MERVRISVPRGRRSRSGDGFQIYSDHGTGSMDWSRPVNSRRLLLWQHALPFTGHALGGHALTPHLDTIEPDGHLEGTHLFDARGYPAAAIEEELEPVVFARLRYAIVMEDDAGNADIASAILREVVVNSFPPAPTELRIRSHDAETGRLELSFKPSSRLTG